MTALRRGLDRIISKQTTISSLLTRSASITIHAREPGQPFRAQTAPEILEMSGICPRLFGSLVSSTLPHRMHIDRTPPEADESLYLVLS
jgi:hypothetical protein